MQEEWAEKPFSPGDPPEVTEDGARVPQTEGAMEDEAPGKTENPPLPLKNQEPKEPSPQGVPDTKASLKSPAGEFRFFAEPEIKFVNKIADQLYRSCLKIQARSRSGKNPFLNTFTFSRSDFPPTVFLSPLQKDLSPYK